VSSWRRRTCCSRTFGRVLSTLGLSPEELWKINPKLVVTRVTGFGQTGPYAERAGFGSIGEAMGGIRYVTGDPDSPPTRTGVSLGDSLAATFAALGTWLPCHQVGRTGKGRSLTQRSTKPYGPNGVDAARVAGCQLPARA